MSLDIRLASDADIAGVTHCICEAFLHYIPRIGRQPGPMLDDYERLVEQQSVYVAYMESEIVGALVLLETEEGFCIETIAIRPRAQGQGIGSRLLSFAENLAKKSAYSSIYLSTNRVMKESQAVYLHKGFVEFDQRSVNGYDRIFYRKQI